MTNKQRTNEGAFNIDYLNVGGGKVYINIYIITKINVSILPPVLRNCDKCISREAINIGLVKLMTEIKPSAASQTQVFS